MKKMALFFFLNSFSITSQNGQIFVACNTTRCLDRERQSVYHFTVEARDGGGKVSSAPVNITLFDLNDNAPIFMHSKYEFGITENSNSISGSDNISVHASFTVSRLMPAKDFKISYLKSKPIKTVKKKKPLLLRYYY